MTDHYLILRNIVLSVVYGTLAAYFEQHGNREAAGMALAALISLWAHSGRKRKPRAPGPSPVGGGASPALPVLCLAALAFAGCRGGSVSWGAIWPWAPSPQLAATHVALLTQASSPLPSSTAGIYAKSSDSLPRLVDTSGNEYVAGTAWRIRSYAGTPGGVTAADIWYDSSAGSPAFMVRGASGSLKLIDSAGGIAPTNFTLAGAVQSGASFFKACTITSAAAATPVVCLSAADVPASLSARLATWHAYVNGGTGWGTTTSCVIEDTSGNDLVTIAVAAMTSNTFIDDGSANVTKEARYRLGTGGASDAGLQISCNANGTGSDLVVTLSGSIQ